MDKIKKSELLELKTKLIKDIRNWKPSNGDTPDCFTMLNDYEKQVKNIAYEPMLTPVLSEWDCDDCKFYPCNLRDKDNKLPYGTCGDHSERMVS
jgi:hypothetical protein